MTMIVRAAALAAVAGLGAAAQAGVMNQYNLIVLGQLNNSSQDVEGRVFVGGNLISGGSPTLAKNLNAAAYAGQTTVAVGGNVSVGNMNLQAGNLRYGGSFSGNFNANGGGNRAQDLSLPGQVAGISAELHAASTALKNLAANSSTSLVGNQLNFNAVGNGQGVAVFNIAGNLLNNGGVGQINLNLAGVSKIVINVSGANVNISSAGNFVGNWQNSGLRPNIIWNFHEATNVNIQKQIFGAVLAADALVTNSTAIEGSVFAGAMNQNGEVHLPGYTGLIPAPGVLALAGLGGLIAARRRR